MIRKIKTLGIAVVAVLALSAVVASAASATNFTASTYPTAGTASSAKGNDDFKTEAGSIECKSHWHWAALSAPTFGVTVTPTFSECVGFGFLSGTFNMNGCDFEIFVDGTFNIKCSIGQVIRWIFGTCEATVGAQNGLKSVALANSGNGISMQANIGGIAYTVTKDGFGCPFSGTGAKTGASFTQNSAIQVSSTNGATIDIG
jgi:hypothetical protein